MTTLSTDQPQLSSDQYSGGPKTPEGKAVSARNATSHGLFARDVVLTHLGEDPEGYRQLLQQFSDQIRPHNLIEQHYVEVITAASWRLRRLQRWQASLYENKRLSSADLLDQLDRMMRHETALLRQIDKAIRQLGKDAPQMFDSRARAQALDEMHLTEMDCQQAAQMEQQVALRSRELLPKAPVPDEFDPERLDLSMPEPMQHEKCQNELPPQPVCLLPVETRGEDGWPVYLSEVDKKLLREMVSEDDTEEAQDYLEQCREEYLVEYRKQELTVAQILSHLDLL